MPALREFGVGIFDAGAATMEKLFTRIASAVAHAAGKPVSFIVCCAIIVLWALSGPLFGFSDTWQLIINTGTTIITFLMVFLIQNTQNRDGTALQTKLDELIRVGEAENRFIGIEHLSESEVEQFRALCEKAAKAHDRELKKKAKAAKARA
jgi:low affinity Fe/Cu permease